MSLVRASQPSATGMAERMRVHAAKRAGLVGLLTMSAAISGCHMHAPGLSHREASGITGRDGAPLVQDSLSGDDAQPSGVQASVSGPPAYMGCSDGTREGFRNTTLWPSIAGCAGSWQRPGLPAPNPRVPTPCAGVAGNDSINRDGFSCTGGDACVGCSVADLCASSWHPCRDGDDVSSHSSTGCENMLLPGEHGLFLAMVGANDDGVCGAGERNDLHGCGNLGQPESGQCSPFTRRMSFADCEASGGAWSCGGPSDNGNEAGVVTKASPMLGGVLCCKD